MNPLVNYTKQQYLGKIEALEGYMERLNAHLTTMDGYKEEINRFWHDPKARDAYEALHKQTLNLKKTMDQCSKALGMYKEIVEQMEGSNLGASDLLKDASSVISLME